MKNKKAAIIIIVVAVLIGIVIYVIPTLLLGTKDENIEKYKAALRETVQGERFHFTQEEEITDISGTYINGGYRIEVYRLGGDFLRMDTFETGKYYTLIYDGYYYNGNIWGEEEIYVSKRDKITPHNMLPNGVSSTYFSIDNRYVTYEETDTQIIVTYDNKFLIGQGSSREYYEADKNGYTSAISVAYFDKEWNLQKLEIIEKWISITEDGQEYEREAKITVLYHETTEEEIEKIFEETKNMLEDLME